MANAAIVRDYIRRGYTVFGIYEDEGVRIDKCDGERLNIWIPSRQESVWVLPERVDFRGANQTA